MTEKGKSALRQIGSILVSIYGVVSTHISAIHLPPAVAGVLAAAGPLVIAIEHRNAGQALKTLEGTPDVGPLVDKVVAAAKADFGKFFGDVTTYLKPPVAPAPASPPLAPPVAPAPAASPVTVVHVTEAPAAT